VDFKTADLYDAHTAEVHVAAPGLRHFGGRRRFAGPICTLKVFEDNLVLRQQIDEPGAGRVMVVDGGASLRAALIGDVLAKRALDNGYAAFVINGCVRDTVECARMDIGIMALAANPTRPQKKGFGERGIPVAFAGVKFTPGEWRYADEDGILLCPRKLL
jgi:regulator of ribonuclease activity A